MSIIDFVHRALGKSKAAAEWAAAHAGIEQAPHVWVKVNLDHPHVGVSNLSDAKVSPYPQSIKVTGVNREDAARLFTGKVPELTDTLSAAIEAGQKPSLSAAEFSSLFK